MFLSDEDKELVKMHLLKIAKYHLLCRGYSAAEGINAWQVKPKAHYGQRFHLLSCLINTKLTQCYLEESTVGEIVKIRRASDAGQHLNYVQGTALLKWLIQLYILFKV